MSFKFKLSEKDRASARLIGHFHRVLAKEIARAGREKNLTQSQIAEKIDVNKSVVSRIVSGNGNITLRTLAELIWALDMKWDFRLSDRDATDGQNEHRRQEAAATSSEPPVSAFVAKETGTNIPHSGSTLSQGATQTSVKPSAAVLETNAA